MSNYDDFDASGDEEYERPDPFADREFLAKCELLEAAARMGVVQNGVDPDEQPLIIMAFKSHTSLFMRGQKVVRLVHGNVFVLTDDEDDDKKGAIEVIEGGN